MRGERKISGMRTILLISAFLSVSIPSSAASLDQTIDTAVRRTMRAFDIPGLAIAVVQNDRVILVQGYGTRETGHDEPVTADTLFELGSTTKAFTTASMAILVEDGKMKWDDPVRNYLPDFRLSDGCANSLVTLRDLVSHRTGLGRHDELWLATDWTRSDILRVLGSLKLDDPIRTKYQYSNLMFVAAGEAVAHAAGMPWEEFVRTRLFGPLGMSNTTTSLAEWGAREHASGHSWDTKACRATVRSMNDFKVIAAAGTVKSSARDLSKWLQFQLSGSMDGKKIVSPAILEQMRTPTTIIPLQGTTKEVYPETNILTYGLGWNVQDYRGELLVAHAGVLNGFRSNVALLPNQNVGIAIIENIGRGYALFSLRNEILDAVLNKGSRDWDSWYLNLERRLDSREEKSTAERESKRVEPVRPLASYGGTYYHPGLGDVVVSLDSSRLIIQWQKVNGALISVGPDTFHLSDDDADVDEDIHFTADTNGVISMNLFGEEFIRQ